MTVETYIREKLEAFGVTDAQLFDVNATSGLCATDEVCVELADTLGLAVLQCLEELLLAPRRTSVSEGGFSVNWDFDRAGHYYLWLCKRHGHTPPEEVALALGISTIKDRTDSW